MHKKKESFLFCIPNSIESLHLYMKYLVMMTFFFHVIYLFPVGSETGEVLVSEEFDGKTKPHLLSSHLLYPRVLANLRLFFSIIGGYSDYRFGVFVFFV